MSVLIDLDARPSYVLTNIQQVWRLVTAQRFKDAYMRFTVTTSGKLRKGSRFGLSNTTVSVRVTSRWISDQVREKSKGSLAPLILGRPIPPRWEPRRSREMIYTLSRKLLELILDHPQPAYGLNRFRVAFVHPNSRHFQQAAHRGSTATSSYLLTIKIRNQRCGLCRTARLHFGKCSVGKSLFSL